MPLSSLLFLSVLIPSNGLASFICLYLGCRRFSAFAVSSVRLPSTSRILVSSIRRSGRPGGAPNGSHPSSSVSSDSHDSVGVRHGFVSLGTVLRAGSVRVSLRNTSSSSRDTPSRAPSLFQHHGSVHESVHKFFFHHSEMPYKARVESPFVCARKIPRNEG